MPKTLLVVDDSTTIRQAARLALAGEDWEIVEAATSGEALQAVRTRAPDAVLCDSSLTTGSGYQLCRDIRGLAQGREIPLILMGASIDEAASAAAGVTQTLAKPFGSEELSAALRLAAELQGFSLEPLGGAALGHDQPLTLEELAGTTSFAAEESVGGLDEAIEIIDLSGDEAYDDLELLEDLEPISVAPPVPPEVRQPWEPDPWLATAPPQEPGVTAAPSEGSFELDFGDLMPSRETGVVPEPETTQRGETVTPLLESGEEPTVELEFEGPGEELPPRADEAARVSWISSAPAESLESAFEPAARVPLETEAAAPPYAEPAELEPFVPLELPPAANIAAPSLSTSALDRAVREALSRDFPPEVLTPLAERIVERIAWEVVPQLADRLIREAIEQMRRGPPQAQ